MEDESSDGRIILNWTIEVLVAYKDVDLSGQNKDNLECGRS